MKRRSETVEKELADWEACDVPCRQQMDGSSCGIFVLMVNDFITKQMQSFHTSQPYLTHFHGTTVHQATIVTDDAFNTAHIFCSSLLLTVICHVKLHHCLVPQAQDEKGGGMCIGFSNINIELA